MHRIFTTPFAAVYPLYVKKVERKGHTQAEVDQVITWLTGFDAAELQHHLDAETPSRTSSPPPASTRSPMRCAA